MDEEKEHEEKEMLLARRMRSIAMVLGGVEVLVDTIQ